MSHIEHPQRAGRQGHRRKHHRWSGPDHFNNDNRLDRLERSKNDARKKKFTMRKTQWSQYHSVSPSQGPCLSPLWWSQNSKDLFEAHPFWRQAAWLHGNARWAHTRTHDSGLQLAQESAAPAQNATTGLTYAKDVNEYKQVHSHVPKCAPIFTYACTYSTTGKQHIGKNKPKKLQHAFSKVRDTHIQHAVYFGVVNFRTVSFQSWLQLLFFLSNTALY